MKWRRYLTKRSLFVACALALPYGGLWLLTGEVGAPQVRSVVVAAMRVPSNYTDVSQRRVRIHGPGYYCVTCAYAPFLVRADYGINPGHMNGAFGGTLYLWLFGHTFRLREIYFLNN